jgi:hypothetical protein
MMAVCDQDMAIEPRAPRPGNQASNEGELVAEQGDRCEQRPARAKGIRHAGGEHGFEPGRSKVTPTRWTSGQSRSSQDAYTGQHRDARYVCETLLVEWWPSRRVLSRVPLGASRLRVGAIIALRELSAARTPMWAKRHAHCFRWRP